MNLVILTVIIAIIFDIINGFHDAANSIATVVSTKVLRPSIAVLWAAFFNFIAIVILAPHVADTIAQIVIIDPHDVSFVLVILSGLLGAIAWSLFTWWKGLPSSSSHALIGGLAGAGIAFEGLDVLHYDLILLTAAFIFISPLMGFIGGFLIMWGNYFLFQKSTPQKVDKFFRRGQLLSAALYSIGHGANDAQKTMGVIFAVLVAGGLLAPEEPLDLMNPKTNWIILICHLAMAFGTAIGGWRIVKTLGQKITPLKPIGGFSAETSGAFTLFLATWGGIPVSTTHTITASILGAGIVNTPLSKIKWLVATRIVWAWILTLPASALIAAAIFYILNR